MAVRALDAVIDEGKAAIDDDLVLQQIVSVYSPETIAEGEPIRAADALVAIRVIMDRIGPPPRPGPRVINPDDMARRRRGSF